MKGNQMTRFLLLLTAVIYGCIGGCPSGEFQTDRDPPICQRCRECEVFKAETCSAFDDAKCCGFSNMTVVAKAKDSHCEYESSNFNYCCQFLSQPTSSRQNKTLSKSDSTKIEIPRIIRNKQAKTSRSSVITTVLFVLFPFYYTNVYFL